MATSKNVVSALCLRIGRKIATLREDKGWSQRMLADHADIEQAHLARIESGLVEPGILVLEKIATALGVSLLELLK